MQEPLNQAAYHKTLTEIFRQKKARNPAYSLRAFAKSIQIDPGSLSRILRGKQIPNYKLGLKIASKLNLSSSEELDFLSSIKEVQEKKTVKRQQSNYLFTRPRRAVHHTDADLYLMMSHWYFTALLELTETDGFKFDPETISRDFGITQKEVKEAFAKLIQIGLLEEQDGHVTKKNIYLTTKDKSKTSSALKENQKQFLTKAIDSLLNDPVEKRSVTSVVMAVDPARLAVAKRMISDFNQALCHYLEKGKRTEVYNLSIALHPLKVPEPK